MEDFKKNFATKGKLLAQESLAKYTSWKVGGKAKYMFFPTDSTTLKEAIEYLSLHEIPWKILGNGSNILISDKYFDGVVIILTKLVSIERQSQHRFIIEAGVSLPRLCRQLAKIGLTGHEFLSGIPGTIGGAVVMNAGTPAGEMKDILISAQVLDTETGIIRIFSNAELEFSYRHSILKQQNKYVILSVDCFFAEEQEAGASMQIIKMNKKKRENAQPLNFPSCGSVFRNPENNFAGKLIEQVGLKGYSIGAALVSPKHANFIVNTGDATATEIRALIELIQTKVEAETNIYLSTEVEFFNF